jgi:hypothetical protein
MKLTPPKQSTFWISVVLAAMGLIGFFVSIPFVSDFAFWFVFVGYVVLFLGTTLEGF